MLRGADSSHRPGPGMVDEKEMPPVSLLQSSDFDDDTVISSWTEPVEATTVAESQTQFDATSPVPAPSHGRAAVATASASHTGHEVPTAVKAHKDGVVAVMQVPTLDAMLQGRRVGRFALPEPPPPLPAEDSRPPSRSSSRSSLSSHASRASSAMAHAAHHVAHRIQQGAHVVVNVVEKMDWFHKRLRHRASMLTPVGESPSLFGSTINLINGSLDAGILAMPLVLAKVGWLLGLFLTGLVAVLGIYTTRLLVMVGVAENTRSYHMTVRHVLGKRVMNVFQFIIIATCMGGLLAYLMLIGDFAVEASLLLGGHVINRNSVIAIMAIFVVLPLSLMRKIKSLWFTGFMALGFVSFCTVALFVELCRLGLADAPDNPDGLPGYKQYGGIAAVSTTLPEFFHALPIAVFACSNHIVVFPVFSEMRQQSVTAFTKVTTITYTVLGALYGCTGLFGYLTFGNNQDANILNHYHESQMIGLVNLCFLFMFTFTYPLVNFAMRISIHYTLFGETNANQYLHVAETVIPLAIALAGALSFGDITLVFSLIGALGTASLYFLFPCTMFLASQKVHVTDRKQRLACIAVLCFGVIVSVCGVVAAIVDR